MSEQFIDKTTVVKTAEPLHLKLERFAKTSKVAITLNIDPNNPISMDQLMIDIAESNTKLAIEAFKTLAVEQLGAVLTDDNGEPVKTMTTKELASVKRGPKRKKKHGYAVRQKSA